MPSFQLKVKKSKSRDVNICSQFPEMSSRGPDQVPAHPVPVKADAGVGLDPVVRQDSDGALLWLTTAIKVLTVVIAVGTVVIAVGTVILVVLGIIAVV